MPRFDLYRKMMGVQTVGQAFKKDADMVMEATWLNDRNTCTCYLYDYWHDDYKTVLKDLHPQNDPKKIAISLKVRTSSQQTFAKDVVTHHIQMMPTQEMCVDYYPAFFEKRYDAIFPVGLYVDVPDKMDIYNRWMVVGLANYHVNQFPTYEILPCDKVLDWIQDNKKIHMAACLRSQSSYNAGVWLDYRVERPEDQQKFILPLNSISEKIYYNKRFIIDTNLDIINGAEPRAWRVTKINRISANGTVLVTCAQDQYDQHHDYIEYVDLSDPSSIVGMWADYYKDTFAPTDIEPASPEQDIISEIICSGKQEIKVDGGYKTLTLSFSQNDKPIAVIPGEWSFRINDEDVSTLLSVRTKEDDNSLNDGQIKIKFLGDFEYMGETLVVTYTADNNQETTISLKIGGL